MCVLSLICCVATVGLAIRAEFAVDKWSIQCYRAFSVESFRRHVVLMVAELPPEQGYGVQHRSGEPIAVAPKYWQVRVGHFGSGISWAFLALPHWLLILLTIPLPAWWTTTTLRDRRRAREGHCVRCGYDLRASPERCPECGAERCADVP
jgi:hypothetical protein